MESFEDLKKPTKNTKNTTVLLLQRYCISTTRQLSIIMYKLNSSRCYFKVSLMIRLTFVIVAIFFFTFIFYLVMRLLQCGQYMQCLLRVGFQVIVYQAVHKHRSAVLTRKKKIYVLNTLEMKHLLQECCSTS